jgi:hypothetical protein
MELIHINTFIKNKGKLRKSAYYLGLTLGKFKRLLMWELNYINSKSNQVKSIYILQENLPEIEKEFNTYMKKVSLEIHGVFKLVNSSFFLKNFPARYLDLCISSSFGLFVPIELYKKYFNDKL